MKVFGYNLGEVRKAVVAGLGAVVLILQEVTNGFGGFIPAGVSHYVDAAIAIATAISVFLTENAVVAVTDG